MTQKISMQEKKSVCEKSMQMMLSIIKFSSFSLATMTLGYKHAKNGAVGLVPVDPFTSFSSNLSRSKTSQAVLSKSYVMEQGAAGDDDHDHVMFDGDDDDSVDDGSFSDYIRSFHRRNQLQSEMNTDGKANAYIRRFHEKNSGQYTLAASTAFIPMVLPPPPNPSLNN